MADWLNTPELWRITSGHQHMHSIQRRQFLHRLSALIGGAGVAGCGGAGIRESAAAETLDPATEYSPSRPTTNAAPLPPAPLSPAPSVTGAGPTPAPAPSNGAPQFTLVSPIAADQAPFCVGFAFKKGDIPAGQGVVANLPKLQVTAKNRWPDGSLKFAVVAGRAELAAGTPTSVALSAGSASQSPALRTADLKATGATASVGCGSFGTASWAGPDWDSPFQEWISGPEMSSWIYRKPVGSDAHLVAWLEVRLYAGGAVEVLPWVENGYLNVAGPTNKSATYAFTLGGTQRFSAAIDLPNHCRTPLLNGTILSHWLGTDPQVTPKHDTLYLQATRLVPTYRASTPAVPSTPFQPLEQGLYPGRMGTAGYHPSIGLLPEWDVRYLTGPGGYETVIRQTYRVGRYPIHHRDQATTRPLRFSDHPTLTMSNSMWKVSHHPSVGFMAYLLTGRHYFMETCQFAAVKNYLSVYLGNRAGSRGVLNGQPRGVAWGWRTLAQAACVTPDADPLRAEFLASLAANAASNHAQYVAQPNNPQGIPDPYSANSPPNNDGYSQGVDPHHDAPWQQDFWTAALGYTKSMGLGDELLDGFFAWKAKSIVGRFGLAGPGEFLYRDAASYVLAVAPNDSSDWVRGTGPWYRNWGEVYAATYVEGSTRYPGPKEAGDGSLRGGHFPQATSYWGNLQPALAYAVEHGVPGASEGYARMVGAPNWAAFELSCDRSPVWSVLPPDRASVRWPAAVGAVAGGSIVDRAPAPAPSPNAGPAPAPPGASAPSPAPAPTPATAPGPASPPVAQPAPSGPVPRWVANLPLWQWYEIPNTALSSVDPTPRPIGNPKAKIDAWCGATLKRAGSVYLIGAAGGHADYVGNEVDALRLNVEVPRWEQLRGPSPNDQIYNKVSFYADRRAAARHTYYSTQFIDSSNRMIVFRGGGISGNHFPPAPEGSRYYGTRWHPAFNMTTGDWEAPEFVPRIPSDGSAIANLVCKHPITEDVYFSWEPSKPAPGAESGGSPGGWWRWTRATNIWEKLSNASVNYSAAAIDPKRNRILQVGGRALAKPLVRRLDGTIISATFGGLGAEAIIDTSNTYPGVHYDEALDKFVVVRNLGDAIVVHTVDAETFEIADPGMRGTPPARRINGIQNSAQYVPELRGFVIANKHAGNVYFARTSL